MPDSKSLPEGWTQETPASAQYTKYVKRGAVQVPKRYAGEPFDRDAVVIASQTHAGVASGPGARSSWSVENPDEVARALVRVVEDWIQAGGDPYGGRELREQLADAATTAADEGDA